MTRATCAVIKLSALQHNLDTARRAAPHARQMAIIKANAYGHGMLDVARALPQADAFGVATVDEAVTLREGGISQPVILLEGFTSAAELRLIQSHQLQTVVHEPGQLALLSGLRGKPVTVWLKIDTGMHRLGFAPEQCREVSQTLLDSGACIAPLHLMTHLACADDRESPMTERQLAVFDQTVSDCQGMPQSIANSAGVLGWPQSHRDWVRPGIMLYGISPFISGTGSELGLQPVMQLVSHLISVKTLKRGETVGYGASWTAPEDMLIGVAAIGYGDGYPRHAASGTPVLVQGKTASLIGRVSMDMITLDLRACPNAQPGDSVTLWGDGLPVETIAAHARTIAYELLCGVTQRVKFQYEN